MVKCSRCDSYEIIFVIRDFYGDASQGVEYVLWVVCGECGASETRLLPRG